MPHTFTPPPVPSDQSTTLGRVREDNREHDRALQLELFKLVTYVNTIPLTVPDGDKGDVTVSGTGTVWTIDSGAVTLAKQADVATSTVFYRKTAGTGVPEVQTLATLKTDLGLTGTNSGDQTITLTGNVTGSGTGSFAATIANDAVTYAKMQDVSAISKLIGRGSAAGVGDPEEITLGTNLSMSGTTLNAAGGGGGGGSTWTEAEVDFLAPSYDYQFTVTDATVGVASKITVIPCGKAATGRTADDWQWDGITFAALPAVGSFTLYAVAHPGPVIGKRKIQYSVAS